MKPERHSLIVAVDWLSSHLAKQAPSAPFPLEQYHTRPSAVQCVIELLLLATWPTLLLPPSEIALLPTISCPIRA